MKKNLLLTVAILLFVHSVFAQPFPMNQKAVDSLTAILNSNANDTAKVKAMYWLGRANTLSDPGKAIEWAEKGLVLAEKIDYRKGLALAYKNTGMGYYLQGRYKETILNWQQATQIFEKIGDKNGIANMLNNQGSVYFNQGDDAKALELYLASLKLSEDINDTIRIVTALNNIGIVYLNKEATYSKALEYFLRSYKLSIPTKDPHSIGTAAVNLGETYYKLGDDSKALIYLRESEVEYEKEELENIPYTLNYIGRIDTRQKKFEDAIQIHTKAYDISKRLDTKLDQAQSLIGLAQAYYAKGDIESSIKAYKQSLEVGVPLRALTEIKDAYEGLSNAYRKKTDFVNAFQYQNLLLAIKDTIYNSNTDKKLGTLQFSFDLEKKESEITLLNKNTEIQQQEIKRQKIVKVSFIGGFAIMLLSTVVFLKQRNRIKIGKKRSDELLLNILPEETAEELKATGKAKTQSFESVSVLFTDFKNFTQASEILTPEELVEEINHCYSEFDRIVTKYDIEKIKTIGDSYMCAGGLPVSNTTHAVDVVAAGLEMVAFIEKNKQERIRKGQPYFELRLGIHSGPVVAGIVGIKKFAYDMWGDTVNTASRMESSGEVGRVNISGSTYELVKEKFTCTHRGKIEAKNKGSIDMYFVEG